MITEEWTYHRTKRYDKNKMRWHFASRYFYVAEGEDEPREIYFRNDDKTEYGMLRFERLQDNPYRDHEQVVTKIMSNKPFRKSLHTEAAAHIWQKNWK